MNLRILILWAIIFQPASSIFAGTESYDSKAVAPTPAPSPGCETPSEWEFRIGFPGWIPIIDGDYGTGRVVGPVHIDISDVLARLDAPFFRRA